MRSIILATMLCLAASEHGVASAQQVVQLPSSWRGVYRYHRGPFGGERQVIRWGNGITPTGGVVLMGAIDVAGDIGSELVKNRALRAEEVNRRLDSLERDMRELKGTCGTDSAGGDLQKERALVRQADEVGAKLRELATALDKLAKQLE